MKKTLKIVGALVLVVILVGFFFPATNQFEETKIIDAPIENVFLHVNDLRNWPKWSPWIRSEPTMDIVYGGQ